MSGRGKKGADDPARVRVICQRFKAGEAMQAIAKDYNISRERIRQILKKYGGLVGADGGAMLAAEIARNKRLAAKDASYLKRYGCTYAQYQTLRLMGKGKSYFRSPCGAFLCQRKNANQRGIEWGLKLWDWWCIWDKSGKWDQRGRGNGYVMARHNDVGPYSVENVKIITGCENSSEAPKKKKHNLPRGVSKREVGNHVSYVCSRMISGKSVRRYGFHTPDEAYNAYLALA